MSREPHRHDRSREMDQRLGRTIAEIEAELKWLSAPYIADTELARQYWMKVGARVALAWVTDTDERVIPLVERLVMASLDRG